MQSFNLIPNDGRKSFYGKARVYQRKDGAAVLRSYETDVCSIDANGVFHRHWDGWSATTQRHVSAFIKLYGVTGGGKKWWEEQPVERFPWVSFYAEKASA